MRQTVGAVGLLALAHIVAGTHCDSSSPCQASADAVATCATSCIQSAAVTQAACATGDYKCQCDQQGVIQGAAANCIIGACGFGGAIDVLNEVGALCACVTASPTSACSSTSTSSSTTTPYQPPTNTEPPTTSSTSPPYQPPTEPPTTTAPPTTEPPTTTTPPNTTGGCDSVSPCQASADAVYDCAKPCIESAAVTQASCAVSDYECQCGKTAVIQGAAVNCVLGNCGNTALDVLNQVSSLCTCVTAHPTVPCTSAPATTTGPPATTTQPPATTESTSDCSESDTTEPPSSTTGPITSAPGTTTTAAPGCDSTSPCQASADAVYDCAKPCIESAAVTQASCAVSDYECQCGKTDVIQGAAVNCVLGNCGNTALDVLNQVSSLCTCVTAHPTTPCTSAPATTTATTTAPPNSSETPCTTSSSVITSAPPGSSSGPGGPGTTCKPGTTSDCGPVASSAVPSCAQACFSSAAPKIPCDVHDYACQCQLAAQSSLTQLLVPCVATACPAASLQAVIAGASQVCACATAPPSPGDCGTSPPPPMQQPPSKFAPNAPDMQPQMVRAVNEHQQQSIFHNSNDWQQQQQPQQPISVTTRPVEDGMPRSNHSNETLGGIEESVELREKPPAAPDPEGWEFPDGSFPEPATGHPPSQTSSYRSDTDAFPNADYLSKSPSRGPGTHRRKSSMSKRRGSDHDIGASQKAESASFKLRFGLRGHLNTVRTVIFSGGGSPGEPEICTAGDDGMIKRFHIPRLDGNAAASNNAASDLDVTANFTHRGHNGAVLSLAAWSPAPNFSTGGRAQGDGWIFSGGQDSTIRVWERGRVDPKATLEGHTDAVWAICVLPTTLGAVFGSSSNYGAPDRILLVSGAADGTVRLWSVSAPPQLSSPQPGSTRAASGRGGRVRGNSMSSGSGFSNSPQPTVASNSPFNHTLVHVLSRQDGSKASPTCITPLGSSGETFVVSYSDAAVLVYDTKTGEQVGYMDSLETYDGSIKTSVNAVVATTIGLDQGNQHHGTNIGGEEDPAMGGPTGGRSMAGSGVEGTIISGHEDRFVRFFDANSGQCTYNMLAHPDAISSLSLSPDGRELVSAGHDASLRFWSLEKRSCIQEITSHRVMRGEGICTCVWSQDGKWVVSGGGDGIVKVFAR